MDQISSTEKLTFGFYAALALASSSFNLATSPSRFLHFSSHMCTSPSLASLSLMTVSFSLSARSAYACKSLTCLCMAPTWIRSDSESTVRSLNRCSNS